jgi:hypothetical protein
LPPAGPPPENETSEAKAHREHHECHRRSHGDAMSRASSHAAGTGHEPQKEKT